MGENCEITCATFNLNGTPVSIELAADALGLTECRLHPGKAGASARATNPHLKRACEALGRYFDGAGAALDCALAPDGTAFQKAVWQAAREIPSGEVRSYSWIADKIKNPKSVRAVAQALAANPLLLFVPCHRVVRNNGDPGGFACGTQMKEQLLELEGVRLPSAGVALAAV